MSSDDVNATGTFDASFAAAVATGWSGREVVSREHAERLGLHEAVRRAVIPPRPKLLVPVDVQALVVAPDGRGGEHVDVAVSTLDRMRDGADVQPSRPGERAAEPFGEVRTRAPGVHLHWAMPDGLTQGEVVGDGAAGELRLRPLPDRWLVARVERGVPHPVTAWVIESDRGRSIPLDDWPRRPADDDPPAIPGEDLTAMTGGDAAWAAVYDDVIDRFAFHDDLSDRRSEGPFGYLVAGWYSDLDLDPLADIRGPGSVGAVLEALGWGCPELDRALRRWRRSRRREPGPADEDSGTTVDPRTSDALKAALAAEISGVRVRVEEERWYPVQSVYHGRIEGVRADGAGHDRRPGADRVRAALGPTSAESHAALVGGGAAEDERLQTAFLFDLLGELDAVDGPVTLDEEVHRRGFASRDGGVVLETIMEGDRLAPYRGADRPTRDVPDAGHGIFDPSVRDELLDRLARGEPVLRQAVERDAVLIRELALRTRPGVVGAATEATGSVPSTVTSADASPTTHVTFTIGGREGLLLPPEVRDRLDELVPKRGGGRGAGTLHARTIERPAPRWFRPQDPVLTLEGLNRSLRAGYDGRFGADEPVLVCRLSGGAQTRLENLLRGDAVVEPVLRRTGVPPEVQELLEELVLADDTFVDDHVPIARPSGPRAAGRAVEDRLRAETRIHRWQGGVEAQLEVLLPASAAVGETASPVGVTFWQQPWVPIYLEWEVAIHHDDPTARRLGELDLAPVTALAEEPEVLAGRSLLSSAAAKAFARAAEAFLAAEEERGGGAASILSADDETVIAELASDAARTDRLVAGLDGLLDHALGYRVNEAVAPESDTEPEVHPTAPPRLLRSGALVVRRLRVVDAFGRFLDLDPAALLVAASADSELADPDGRPALDLPPRITGDTRLWVRFVDADDPSRDAHLDQESGGRSPVAGWLLPDHVDRSLEVFDADGLALGQLRHATLGGDVIWEGAPGSERTAAALPAAGEVGTTLAAFAAGLVARDAAERSGSVTSSDDAATEERESPLSALLRAVDTTLWTVDPFGEAGDEHVATLIGHPIAVVRARVTLEVFDDTDTFTGLDPTVAAARRAAFARLREVPFEVRLGALTRVRDGLLGWFVDDDYRTFHPVHPSILAEAEPSGFPGEVGDDLRIDPITSPYVTPDATLTLHPGETRWLTLLLSPAGRLHATSGIVPRKSVGLLREWTARPLARIAPSFRVGPVLVDPSTIRMPRPGLSGEPSWTHRGTPTTWVDDPLLPSSTDALLPDRAPLVQEGWIRITRGDAAAGS